MKDSDVIAENTKEDKENNRDIFKETKDTLKKIIRFACTQQ